MKENLWKWRSSQKSLLKDPRERMSTEKKMAILEELLEKENKERKERAEVEKKKWMTIREVRKLEKAERLEKKDALEKGIEMGRKGNVHN